MYGLLCFFFSNLSRGLWKLCWFLFFPSLSFCCCTGPGSVARQPLFESNISRFVTFSHFKVVLTLGLSSLIETVCIVLFHILWLNFWTAGHQVLPCTVYLDNAYGDDHRKGFFLQKYFILVTVCNIWIVLTSKCFSLKISHRWKLCRRARSPKVDVLLIIW